jgi:hypothetical protein
MKAKQGMHQKMAVAKTRAERDAVMPEHMQLMQESLSRLRGMDASSGRQTPPHQQLSSASSAAVVCVASWEVSTVPKPTSMEIEAFRSSASVAFGRSAAYEDARTALAWRCT